MLGKCIGRKWRTIRDKLEATRGENWIELNFDGVVKSGEGVVGCPRGLGIGK